MSIPPEAGEPEPAARGRPKRLAERRWPMAAAVLSVVVFQAITPKAGRVPVWWIIPIVEVVMLGVLIVRDPGRIDRRSRELRRETIALIALMTLATLGAVLLLSYQIVHGTRGISATALLGRGATVWATNVIVFSLWYWELDRGGPAERAAGAPADRSFLFQEESLPERLAAGWFPTYPDYLYLSFSTATAFSATDTAPVRTWAKMTLMFEAALSLVVAILVVARAINVLPGT